MSNSIDPLYQKMSELRNISDLNIYPFCFDDRNVINATCFLSPKGKNYFVGIPTGTILRLYDLLNEFLYDEKIRDIPLLKEIMADDLFVSLYVNALHYIVKHEYMHIIYGHCLYANQRGMYYMEESCHPNQDSSINQMKNQAMELIADVFAVKDSISQILPLCNGNITLLKQNVLIYYLSILFVFSIFYIDEHIDWEDPGIIHSLIQESHPCISTRFFYIADAVDSELLFQFRQISEETVLKMVEEIDKVIDLVYQISAQYNKYFKMELVEPAYSKAGLIYYKNIMNACKEVVGENNDFAFYKTEGFKDIQKVNKLEQEINELRRQISPD